MCRRGAQTEVLLWQGVLKQGLSHRETAQKAAMYTGTHSSALRWNLANAFPERAGPAHRCGSSPQVWVQPGPGRRDCVPPQGTYSRSARVIDNLRSLYSLGILTGVKVLVNYTR